MKDYYKQQVREPSLHTVELSHAASDINNDTETY